MTDEWIKVAHQDEIPEGGTLPVFFAGEPVCLYKLAGVVYATDDTCTHGGANLSDGYIEGDTIECPLHQGCFHIPTGRATSAPCTIDLRTYPIRIEDGAVQLKLE